MTNDRLAELLRGADEVAPPPLPARELAQQVRLRARAQTRQRQVATAALLVVFAGVATWIARREPFRTPLASNVAPIVSPAEIAQLKAQGDLHLNVANTWVARQSRLRPRTLVIGPTLESERDKAALAMLDHAERLRRDLKEIDAALAAYRRTIELFPGTRWAAVAKQRIEQLRPDARRTRPEHTLT